MSFQETHQLIIGLKVIKIQLCLTIQLTNQKFKYIHLDFKYLVIDKNFQFDINIWKRFLR